MTAKQSITNEDPDEKRFFEQALHFQSELLRLLLHHTGNRADAEDLLGDVYLVLVTMSSEERSTIRSLKAFCRKVAKNKARDWVRHRRVISFEPLVEAPDPTLTDDRPSLDRIVIAQEEVTLIGRVIQQLPTRCREIFKRRRQDGESIRVIAAEFHIQETTVKDHLARADAKIERFKTSDTPLLDDRASRIRRRSLK
jgi:RNA polymerase sigma-70 factor (ECF subfamily)